MKIYLAYKLSGENIERVKLELLEIEEVINCLGHQPFIFIKDAQNWVPWREPKRVINEAMKHMKSCDAIISIICTNEKGEGMLLETGFMKALNKKVIVASKHGVRAVLLKAIADYAFEFKDIEEFRIKLSKCLFKLSKTK